MSPGKEGHSNDILHCGDQFLTTITYDAKKLAKKYGQIRNNDEFRKKLSPREK